MHDKIAKEVEGIEALVEDEVGNFAKTEQKTDGIGALLDLVHCLSESLFHDLLISWLSIH